MENIGTQEENISELLTIGKDEVTGAGELKFGESEFYATRGEKSLKIIQGRVNQEGITQSGEGFSSSKFYDKQKQQIKGIYEITFDAKFDKPPSVIVTQICSINTEGDSTKYNDYKTTDNAVVVLITTEKCRIKCGNSDGNGDQRHFSFLCIGT